MQTDYFEICNAFAMGVANETAARGKKFLIAKLKTSKSSIRRQNSDALWRKRNEYSICNGGK